VGIWERTLGRGDEMSMSESEVTSFSERGAIKSEVELSEYASVTDKGSS